MGVCPVLDDAVQLIHAIGQGGRTWLQDVGRFDFKNLTVFDGRDVAPTCTGSYFFRAKFFAAPRTDDDVWAASDDLHRVSDDAVFAHGLQREFGKTVVTACSLNELGHPANGADGWLVPFFKIHLGAFGIGLSFQSVQMLLHGFYALQALCGFAHHGRNLVEHGKNLVHAALIEHRDLHTMANQLRSNVGLQV